MAPVSVSTSTTQTWVPAGHVKFGGSKTAVPSSIGSTPAGRSCACQADAASSGIVRALSGAPFTRNAPSLHSRSSCETSSSCAAIRLAFSRTRSTARRNASPPTDARS